MKALLAIGLLASIAAGNGCRSGSGGGHPSTPPGVTLSRISVTSKAFTSGGAVPVDYSCDGADRSPPLTWSAPPEGTKSIAILADDPDSPGGDFTHWIAYDIPPSTVSVPEAVDAATLGGDEGTNSFGRGGYGGPCPPRQEMHRYYFHVFALNASLGLKPGATRDTLDAAMSHRVLAEGFLMGTFAH
jgi:Raf kinase inhibitor-like YbhB/YbcL family protein